MNSWPGNKPNTLPRLSDDRLAELVADRTGWDLYHAPTSATPEELLSGLDELRAWRRYKLTDEEKVNLRALHEACARAHEEHFAVAFAAIDRMAGKSKTDG